MYEKTDNYDPSFLLAQIFGICYTETELFKKVCV